MSGLPWPEAEVAWFTSRARRAMDGHPRAAELVGRVLVHLATHDLGDGPVRDLGAWAKKHSIGRLREYIEQFDRPDIRRFAEAEVGWSRRRGDIVHLRSKASWWDLRTK